MSLADKVMDIAIEPDKLSLDPEMILGAVKEEGFSSLVLNGDDLLIPGLSAMMREKDLRIAQIRNLSTPSLSRSIMDQGETIQQRFVENVAVELETVYSLGCRIAGFDFDIPEASVADSRRRQSLIRCLRLLAAEFYAEDMTLSVAVRLPGTDPDRMDIAGLLRETMMPNVRLGLDIHPHELPANSAPAELMRGFRSQLATVSFAYDAQAGNHLTETLLQPWMNYLGEEDFRGIVAFFPHSSGLEQCFREMASLRMLISRMNIT